ncbi:hypothetical protein CPB84DRAFT_1766370 [Gymnopilus junonius]|uniref:HTH psq-type domain-containing protein n=1 Tax=Gymnopilus junonius TaxID=109634 RepID=A0A9P5TRK4_GYMJU|nr:hypothetical protein CPB84DRAFT_1766370 [Gymnopilus junonius]
MEASPQYDSSQWYAPLPNPYAPEGSIYRPYPSPAPSDPSPLPRPHQLLDTDYHSQMKPNPGPTRAHVQGRPPHASDYSNPSMACHHLKPASIVSPYHLFPRSRAGSAGHSPAPSSASHSSRPPLSGPVRTRLKQPKQRLRDSDRRNICLYHLDHPNARQEDIGAAFNVERSTISKILKSKDKWLKINPDDDANETSSKHRSHLFILFSFFPLLTKPLDPLNSQRLS